jgi:DNA gyrase inhibitor GyrI
VQLEREFKESLLNIRNYISVRHFGPYEDVNETWARLTQFAFEQGIGGPQVTAFGVCHDTQAITPPSHIRYDACLGIYPETYLQLAQKLTNSDQDEFSGIRLETMVPQRTVMTIHKGSYRDIREAYTDALRAAATKKLNFDPRRLPTIEIYRNNPLFTKPEALVTEIHFLSGDGSPKAS